MLWDRAMVQDKSIYFLKRGEPSKIILKGKYSYGIENIKIKSWNEGAHLFIGSFCSIAENQIIFLGGNHRSDWSTTFPFGHIFQKEFPAGEINGHGHPATKGHVIIENDVWIGQDCTIMSGIKIGSGSIIAAKSTVVKDVKPYTIVGGNPAKKIKERFSKNIIEKLQEIKWWDQSDEQINRIIPFLQMPPDDETLNLIKERLSSSI